MGYGLTKEKIGDYHRRERNALAATKTASAVDIKQ
jgi:hypothetical protein